MRIEVYESDAEALEAAAALAETWLGDEANARPVVGIAGGRGGRAIMLALSGREGIPWRQARFCVVDETLEEPSNRELLREHLLLPRGLSSSASTGREDRASIWENEVRTAAGPDVVFDLLLLDLGPRGEIGVLDVERMAVDEAASIVRTAGRIGLGPAALRAARRTILVATGTERRHALAAAVRPTPGAPLPAQLVLPGARVTWVVDRAAATELLRDARPASA